MQYQHKRAIATSLDCDAALETQQVATIPGIAFGADDHIRLLMPQWPRLKKGMDRLDKFLRSRC